MDVSLNIIPIFQNLGESEQKLIRDQLETIDLSENQILFNQNDPVDGLYIVESGLLAGLLPTEKKLAKIAMQFKQGELVGELSLLNINTRNLTIKAVQPTRLLKLSKIKFEKLIAEHPELLKIINNYTIKRFLKNSSLLSKFTEQELDLLAEHSEQVVLNKKEILLDVNQACRGVFLITTGTLAAEYTQDHKIERTILKSGRIIGIEELLTDMPHQEKIYALRNSNLIRIKREKFLELSRSYPDLMIKISGLVVGALKQKASGQAVKSQSGSTVVLLPANPESENLVVEFYSKLKSALPEHYNCTVIYSDLLSNQLGQHAEESDITKYLDHLELNFNLILYASQSYNSKWNLNCLNHAERVIVIAQGNSEAAFSPFVEEILADPERTLYLKKELVLIYQDPNAIPSNTLHWLNKTNFYRYHHLRLYELQDIKRLIRFLTGRAFGLVLPGAGSKGWLYGGVLKAILDAGLPVDALGGTSAGALATASMILTDLNVSEFFVYLKKIFEQFVKDLSFKGYTYPIISFSGGRYYTEMIKTLTKSKQIENLWRPFFCVSCNVSQSSVYVHQKGSLWRALRATTSLPAVFPPLCENGDLLVDGGTMNNQPVDIMKALLDHQGLIMTVDMSQKKVKQYNFPPSLSNWDLLKYRYKLGDTGQYDFPPLMDYFLGALLAGENARQKDHLELADLVFEPHLGAEYTLFGQTTEQIRTLIKLGYDSTRERITLWKQHNPNWQKDWMI